MNMDSGYTVKLGAALVATLALTAGGGAFAGGHENAGADHSKMDHSKMDHGSMDHSGHSMERDELGRIGFNMKHTMDDALMKELRQKIALFANYSDADIAMSMDMMGPEYAWYISPPEVKAGQGVLVLMHGFREQGDKMFKKQIEPIGQIYPTAMGVGMSMMMSSHIQTAIDELEKAGATKIAVVPVTSSATNELYRQWLYIFGKQKESEYASVGRVKSKAKLLLAPPPGDDPLVAEILLDHATEISKDPANEFVVIAGHGPSAAEDNEQELRVLAGLAKIVKEDGGFADVYGQTLQDDAPPAIRAANVQRLRDRIEAAQKSGKKVLVVTNLIGARTIQAKLRDDLKGLDFNFNAKGIAQHPNFMKWMGEAVRKQFEEASYAKN